MIELSDSIIEYISGTFGKKFLDKYKNFVFSTYPSYIRLNDNVTNIPQIIKQLEDQGIYLKNTNVNNACQIITGENYIGKTIEHILGKFYIQSLSSMLPAHILAPKKENIVLDLCAAPGSKSTQIAELMEFKGTLYTNEPNHKRIKALIHNLDKSNAMNMWVLKGQGELLSKVYHEYFDKILVDAPCSALGVLQKNQEVSNWWDIKSAPYCGTK